MSNFRHSMGVALVLALAGASGCASGEPAPEGADVDLLSPSRSLNLDNQALAVAVSDVATRTLEGFDPMLNQTTGKRCLDTTNITYKAGAVSTASALTLEYIESQSELAAQLGVTLSSGTFSTSPSTAGVTTTPAGLAYAFNKSSSSANFLLKAKATWQLSANSEGVLKPEYVALLESNPDRFMLDCGAYYISKVMYEASVYALITFTSTGEGSVASLSQQLSGDLGLKFGTKSLDVKASADVGLKRVKNTGSLKYTMTMATSGFFPAAAVSATPLSTSTPFDFSANVMAKPDLGSQITGLAGLVQNMNASLGTDIAALATRVAPEPLPSNSVIETLLSQPAYVRLRRYSHVAPTVPSTTWDTMFTRIQKSASAYEQGQALYDEMAYRDSEEIARYIGDRGNGHLYAMPSLSNGGNEASLKNISTGWKNAFAPGRSESLTDPDALTGGGTFAAPLAKALRRCAMDFDLGKYDSCAANPALLSAISKGRAALAKYKAQRIAHLRVFDSSAEHLSWDNAIKRCGTALGPESTLPVKEDVAQFGPLLANLGGKVWYRSNSSCKRRVYSTANPDECDDGTVGTGVFGLHEQAFACTPATGSLFADYSTASPSSPPGF